MARIDRHESINLEQTPSDQIENLLFCTSYINAEDTLEISVSASISFMKSHLERFTNNLEGLPRDAEDLLMALPSL